MLFVEHDMDMVHDISDWVVVMAEGRIIAEGTPTQISANPAVIDAYLGAHQGKSLLAAEDPIEAALQEADHIEASLAGATSQLPRRRTKRDAVLEATDLVAGYIPEVNILNGCNLVVHEGDFVGIIGPNGAGKSTLLKAVLGLCTVRSGTVMLDGHDITGRKAHELVSLGVGYVPQNKNVFQTLTVTENLRWAAS